MKTVYSAAQPSGKLHIGNYCGALKNWVQLQEDYSCSFCIADSHAITVDFKPMELRENILDNAALYLSIGLNPEKTNLYVQSAVPQHTELAWMLNCTTPLPWLEKMTQFKDKSQKIEGKAEDKAALEQKETVPGSKAEQKRLNRLAQNKNSASAGLLNYPVLMAADILLYDTDVVPVGDDQKQHLELTRNIAERFNSKFGHTFTVPQTRVPTIGARIMSLSDPEKKMSKSDENPFGAIYLLDDVDTIKKKVSKAKTNASASFDPETEDAGPQNLVSIYSAFANQSEDVTSQFFAGKGYGEIKREVTDVIVATLDPIRNSYGDYRQNPDKLISILNNSAEVMKDKADKTIARAANNMGLYRGYGF